MKVEASNIPFSKKFKVYLRSAEDVIRICKHKRELDGVFDFLDKHGKLLFTARPENVTFYALAL